MERLVQSIETHIGILNANLDIDSARIKLFVDRVRVYLNRKDVPLILSSTIAEMIVEQYALHKKNEEEVISSISDNGQTISFSSKVYSNMISQTDNILFASHTSILNRFRKVGVIGVNPFEDV